MELAGPLTIIVLALMAIAIIAYALARVRARARDSDDPGHSTAWSVLATYSSGLEADFVIERLRAAEIPSLRDSNDTVGIFGPGFQGASARGISVLVPTDLLDDARAVVTPSDDSP